MTLTGRDENVPGAAAPPTPEPPKRAAGRRRRTGPAAPAARFEPGRVADARHRNPTWIIAGVLLVLLSALGGVLLFTSSDDRVEVLVAAADMEPGRAVVASDLRIERVAVDAGVRTIPAVDADSLVGELPVGLIPAGSMLAPQMFDTAISLGPDEMIIGAALDPGEAPMSDLQVGAAVELFDVSVSGADAAAGSAPAATAASTIGTGTVWAAEDLATGQIWVSVRVDRTTGATAALVSAQDRLRIVLVGGTP